MRKTATEKRIGIEEQIKQLENQRKQLIQKEKEAADKARTRRLIQRGAIAESFISNAPELANDQFKEVLASAFNGNFPQKKYNIAEQIIKAE